MHRRDDLTYDSMVSSAQVLGHTEWLQALKQTLAINPRNDVLLMLCWTSESIYAYVENQKRSCMEQSGCPPEGVLESIAGLAEASQLPEMVLSYIGAR